MITTLAASVSLALAAAGCGDAGSGRVPATGYDTAATSVAVSARPDGSNSRGAPALSSARPPLSDPPDPGPPPEDHGLEPQELQKALASSVRVTGLSCGIRREGSGFAVGDGDLIVTNAHLLLGLQEPEVEALDGRKLNAAPVAFDPVNDLAVLRVQRSGLTPLTLADDAPDGALGAVLAWEDEAEPAPTPFRIDRPVQVVTEIVGSEQREKRPSWLLSANIEQGDSGAALVWQDPAGATVAVGVVWGASRRGKVAYATRASELSDLLDSDDLREVIEVPDCRR